MSSAYPGGLDDFATDRANATPQTTTHPADHNNLADAVNKIEATLGVDPQGAFSTVVERLDNGGSQSVFLVTSPVITHLSAALVQDLSGSPPFVGGVALFTIPAGAVLLDLWPVTTEDWDQSLYVDDPSVDLLSDAMIDGVLPVITDSGVIGPALRGNGAGFANLWAGSAKGSPAVFNSSGDIRCWADSNLTPPATGSSVFKALYLMP